MKKLENVLKNKIVIFIIFLIFLTPYYFETIEIVKVIFDILNIVTSIFFIIMYLINKKINKIFFPLMGYYFILLISTIINYSGLIYYSYKVLTIFGFIAFVDLLFENDSFFKPFISYITIFNIINFISILISPNRNININVNRIYFLGYDNDFNLILTMACYILLIYHYKLKKEKGPKYNKIRIIFYINYVVAFISAFFVQSATFKISMLMFLFCYFFFFATSFLPRIVFNYKVYLTLAYIIFIGLVFFNVQNNFGTLLGSLNRDITFTGRTEIWDKTLEEIEDNKIIGTGYMNMKQRMEKMNIYHAHSTYLNILLESGIIGELTYLILLIFIGCRIKKIDDKNLVNIASFAIFTYLIMSIFEVYIDILYFYLLVVVISNLSNNNKTKIIYRR